MKRLLYLVSFLFLLAGCSADFLSTEPTGREMYSSHPVSPGSVLDPGGYILFENLNISYDGDVFSITNNREDIVRVSVLVVGVKADGDYDLIQVPAFYGIDKTQYQRDLAENGWAIEQPTNVVMPGKTLSATLYIYDFGGNYPSPDVDGDGYYDIVFCVHPQRVEDAITTSIFDPESEVYKLKVN